MSDFYPLLYLPLLGLTALCLTGCWKFIKERRQHSREAWVKTGGALLGLVLFTASYAVMVVTHARAFKAAILLIMAMSLVNLLRTNLLSNCGRGTPGE